MENKTITCPNCKSENINFSIIRRKSNIIRFFKYTSIILMTMMVGIAILEYIQFIVNVDITSTNNAPFDFKNAIDGYLLGFRIFTISTILLQGLQIFIERKEKIQCICKNCGHPWTID